LKKKHKKTINYSKPLKYHEIINIIQKCEVFMSNISLIITKNKTKKSSQIKKKKLKNLELRYKKKIEPKLKKIKSENNIVHSLKIIMLNVFFILIFKL
jgi:hypothetical protein